MIDPCLPPAAHSRRRRACAAPLMSGPRRAGHRAQRGHGRLFEACEERFVRGAHGADCQARGRPRTARSLREAVVSPER